MKYICDQNYGVCMIHTQFEDLEVNSERENNQKLISNLSESLKQSEAAFSNQKDYIASLQSQVAQLKEREIEMQRALEREMALNQESSSNLSNSPESQSNALLERLYELVLQLCEETRNLKEERTNILKEINLFSRNFNDDSLLQEILALNNKYNENPNTNFEYIKYMNGSNEKVLSLAKESLEGDRLLITIKATLQALSLASENRSHLASVAHTLSSLKRFFYYFYYIYYYFYYDS